MRLVIISKTPHHLVDGKIVGHGATVREISYLSSLFDEVIHIADLIEGEAPASEFGYESDNVRLVGIKPGGGTNFAAKLKLLFLLPQYIIIMLRELRHADVVHVRCPAGISLYAVVLLALLPAPRKRWVKYAGNWKPIHKESIYFKFQRWWLKRNLCRANVTVNGEWDDQPQHITTFLNPCLTDDQIEQGAQAATNKQIDGQVRLLYVGNVYPQKGVGRAIEVVNSLKQAGCDVIFDIVGDGVERSELEARVREFQLTEHVIFHGGQPRDKIDALYAQAHILLFPSESEGWPKVLSESMAYGVVPIAGAVGSIPLYLERFGAGKVLPPMDVQAFTDAVIHYMQNSMIWKSESQRGVEAAQNFSYTNYLNAVRNLLGLNR